MKRHVANFERFSVNEEMGISVPQLSANQYYHAGYYYPTEYEWTEKDNINTKDLQEAKSFIVDAIEEAAFPEFGQGLFYIVVIEVGGQRFRLPTIDDSGSRGEAILNGDFDEVLMLYVTEEDREEAINQVNSL